MLCKVREEPAACHLGRLADGASGAGTVDTAAPGRDGGHQTQDTYKPQGTQEPTRHLQRTVQ